MNFLLGERQRTAKKKGNGKRFAKYLSASSACSDCLEKSSLAFYLSFFIIFLSLSSSGSFIFFEGSSVHFWYGSDPLDPTCTELCLRKSSRGFKEASFEQGES